MSSERTLTPRTLFATVERTKAVRIAETLQGEAPGRGKSRRPRLKSIVVIALLILGVLALVVGGYFLDNPRHDSSAISFAASLSAPTIGQNQLLRVTLSATNHLPYPNQPSDYGVFWEMNLTYWTNPTCDFNHPFRLAAYQGIYTLTNFSAANKVQIFDPSSYFSCPAQPLVGTPNTYSVWPYSTAKDYVDIGGYWAVEWKQTPGVWTQQPEAHWVLHPLPPGPYTIIAADGWGHLQALYFRVT